MSKRNIILILLACALIITTGCSSKAPTESKDARDGFSSSASGGGAAPSASSAPGASSAPMPAPSMAPGASGSASSSAGGSAGGSADSADSGRYADAPAGPGSLAPEMPDARYSDEDSGAKLEYAPEEPMAEFGVGDSPDDTDPQWPVNARSGLLTAGEWNDNKNYDFILDLVQTHSEWRIFEKNWQFGITNRIQVVVLNNEVPVANARVELLDQNEKTIFSAQTDNNGVAYLFGRLATGNAAQPAFIRASTTVSETVGYDPNQSRYEIALPDQQQPKSLELMLVIDTTGSMGDELSFLQAELDDVIKQVSRNNANLPIRLSINVYRDIGDDYVVRSMPFEKDINNQLAFLNRQRASGGGDFEEAVELALADALENHDWNESATAKLLLLVLDAPPHNTPQIRDEMHRLVADAARQGIRIIPVASSGIDKDTEFLLRVMAMATGGTYIFLTDHSGIGGSHIEPTIGDYDVELLNELLVRVINGYIK